MCRTFTGWRRGDYSAGGPSGFGAGSAGVGPRCRPLRSKRSERINHLGRKRKREGDGLSIAPELDGVEELGKLGVLPGLKTSERHESADDVLEILRGVSSRVSTRSWPSRPLSTNPLAENQLIGGSWFATSAGSRPPVSASNRATTHASPSSMSRTRRITSSLPLTLEPAALVSIALRTAAAAADGDEPGLDERPRRASSHRRPEAANPCSPRRRRPGHESAPRCGPHRNGPRPAPEGALPSSGRPSRTRRRRCNRCRFRGRCRSVL